MHSDDAVGGGRDILVVDDQSINLVAYEAALAPLGRNLVFARSGTEALGKLLDQDYALVLLDVAMPDLDGVATARMIRQRRRNETTPIIFITGMESATNTIVEAYEAGGFDFVIKPVLPEVLRAKVRVHLRLQERAKSGPDTASKNEFLAMLGHELRNPLAAIVGALDVIKLRDGTLDRELAILDRQAAHLTRSVEDLLDVARITQGKIELRREAVSLGSAIESAIEVSRVWITQASHQVTVDIAQPLIVDADRTRLVQVLANIITNAAQYTPNGGAIDIVARQRGMFAEIRVRDTGRGMPAALLANVFDLFVQGPRTPDRREGGLGVGLTLVRHVVEQHGGTVDAESDGPGMGSTFIVRWPIETPRTRTAKIQALPRPLTDRPLRMLVVDDNLDTADMLAAVMLSLGHDVLLAHTGAAAIAQAEQFQPEVALLDLGLPDVDGYELARSLRALPGLANLRLIAVTGFGEKQDRERSHEAGFAHHLVKPVDLETLRALLETDD